LSHNQKFTQLSSANGSIFCYKGYGPIFGDAPTYSDKNGNFNYYLGINQADIGIGNNCHENSNSWFKVNRSYIKQNCRRNNEKSQTLSTKNKTRDI